MNNKNNYPKYVIRFAKRIENKTGLKCIPNDDWNSRDYNVEVNNINLPIIILRGLNRKRFFRMCKIIKEFCNKCEGMDTRIDELENLDGDGILPDDLLDKFPLIVSTSDYNFFVKLLKTYYSLQKLRGKADR